MKKISNSVLLSLWLFSLPSSLSGQERVEKMSWDNAVQADLGGHCILYGIGYERTVFRTHPISIVTGVNFSLIPAQPLVFVGNLQPGVLLHIGNSAIEAGLGLGVVFEPTESYSYASSGSTDILLTPKLGYRYHFGKGRWFLKFGITPLIAFFSDEPYYGRQTRWETLFWLNPAGVGFRF